MTIRRGEVMAALGERRAAGQSDENMVATPGSSLPAHFLSFRRSEMLATHWRTASEPGGCPQSGAAPNISPLASLEKPPPFARMTNLAGAGTHRGALTASPAKGES